MIDPAREGAGPTDVGSVSSDISPQPAAVSFLPDPTNAEAGPFGRPFALVRALAGFMGSTNVVAHIPNISQQPQATVLEVFGRFGRAMELAKVPHAGRPRFEPVRNTRILRLLDRVVSESMVPAALDNLVGFEWVEIAPILAGRLLSGHEPWPSSIPAADDEIAVARFCLFSFSDVPTVQIDRSTATIASAVAVRPEVTVVSGHAAKDRDGLGTIALNVRISVHPVADPIRVLIADGRAIALSGVERLLSLHRAGISRALCCVHYGYGVEVLTRFPTTPRDLICSERPPLVLDFLDTSVAVTLPARIHRTSVGMSINMVTTT